MFGTQQKLDLDLSKTKEQQQGFDPVPNGEYTVQCDEAELKHTRSGNGQYIKCRFKIIEGEFLERKIFLNFNIANDSQKAVEIGLGQLKSFLKCSTKSEIEKLTDVSDLIGLSCKAIVKIRRDENYGDSNIISYFKATEKESQSVKKTSSKKNPFS
jgi:hypothetical protein